MRMPSHSTLCSFVFSLLLTSAMIPSQGNVSLAGAGGSAAQMAAVTVLNGLRAQGLAGGSSLALPSPAATPAAATPAAVSVGGPALTPEVLAKLLKMTADQGVDRDLVPLVANTLGLTPAGQSWISRSLTWKENDGTLHSFSVSRGTDQDVVFGLNLSGTVYGYRARRDGAVVAAFTYSPTTRQVTVVPTTDAQKPLDAQIAFWTSIVSNTTTASNN